MKQRVLRVLPMLFVCSMAVVVFADKKTASVVIKLVRLEGKADEIVLNPAGYTTDKSVPWTKSKNTEGNTPSLEFTESDPDEFSCDLEFDGFETQENVYTKNIAPLESLIAVDPNLKRPPLVGVSFTPANAGTAFKGVLSQVNVKYTLFLTDGTPTRATVNIKMKQASSASVKKDGGCP
jgi:Contractile injection system tube protein